MPMCICATAPRICSTYRAKAPGTGAGVLLRALQPLSGIEHMRQSRKQRQHARSGARAGPLGRRAADRSPARRYRPVSPRTLVDRQRRRAGRRHRPERAHRAHQGRRCAFALFRRRQRLSERHAAAQCLARLPARSPQALAAQRVLVLDGALATELERRGADLTIRCGRQNACSSARTSSATVHLDYLRAGADIVTTATYQATFEGFGRRGIGQEGAARSDARRRLPRDRRTERVLVRAAEAG